MQLTGFKICDLRAIQPKRIPFPQPALNLQKLSYQALRSFLEILPKKPLILSLFDYMLFARCFNVQ